MEYNQLILANEDSLTVEQKQFVGLHKEIVYYGNTACEFAFKTASKLKEMRDTKLYAEAGFTSFGEYAENAVGIKERQAYNYIKVYEELPEEFLHSNAKVGITKLLLLASVEPEERAEILETTDVEDVSVRELKAQIEALQAENEQLHYEIETMDVDEVEESLRLAVEKANKTAEESKKKALHLEFEIKENKEKAKKLEQEKLALEKQIEALKNSPKEKETEIKTVADPTIEAELKKVQSDLKNKEGELKSRTAEIEALNKKLLVASDTAMTKFSIKFEDLQKVGNELIVLLGQLDADKKEKCISAIKKIVEGWKL